MTPADVLLPLGLAAAGVIAGLAWRIPSVAQCDSRLMLRINQGRWPDGVDKFLGLVRIAGSTSFFVPAIVLVALIRPEGALALGWTAVAAEVVAKALKLLLRRPRPFTANSNVVVRLPRLPIDPSFPSADTMRAAFLAGLTGAAAPGAWWLPALAGVLAAAIGVGRVRAGAHYALDVLTGCALGLGAAFAWTRTL